MVKAKRETSAASDVEFNESSTKRSRAIDTLSAKKANHDVKVRHEYRKQDRTGDYVERPIRNRLKRRERKRAGDLAEIVAYDFETTSIEAGTPKPLYITAFSDELNFVLSQRLDGIEDVGHVLNEHLLIDRFAGVKFVAWNGNGYDVYFIALALMRDPRYVLRPYLTKSKSLRGLRVIVREDLELKPNQQRAWEFLDGISMLGLQGKSLKEFLKTFAPEYQKQERESFDKRAFNPDDPEDIAYAFRDSEGLYFGMQRAQEIVSERFRTGLRATIGNLGIKIFESRIPEDVVIVEPKLAALEVLRDYVCRGGYCHLMRKYRGPVWKYDLNQAYAAAMRETKLPCGESGLVRGESRYAKVYMARVTASKRGNVIPFYCRELVDGRIVSRFILDRIDNSWLTSSEIEQLRAEGWSLRVHETWAWFECFNMSEYVTALETLRSSAPGGPSGAVGTMIKAIGNNSYGKTLEQLEPLELVLAAECPPGFVDYYGQENPSMIPFVWCRIIDTPSKNYHQPQIGAFITAHVRMVIRRAALLAPREFLYADTDCVIFSKDVTKQLDIDARRYGAFKQEEAGTEFMLIAKKVYCSMDFSTKHSKGMNVKQLEFGDFVKWYSGAAPIQHQVQRQNFVKVMRGGDMFLDRTRKGTRV